jgi:hypothetical protein
VNDLVAKDPQKAALVIEGWIKEALKEQQNASKKLTKRKKSA